MNLKEQAKSNNQPRNNSQIRHAKATLICSGDRNLLMHFFWKSNKHNQFNILANQQIKISTS